MLRMEEEQKNRLLLDSRQTGLPYPEAINDPRYRLSSYSKTSSCPKEIRTRVLYMCSYEEYIEKSKSLLAEE